MLLNALFGLAFLLVLTTACVSPAAAVVPQPVKTETLPGAFTLSKGTRITYPEGNDAAAQTAAYLASALRPATGFDLPLAASASGQAIAFDILDDPALGEEGYRLRVAPERITIAAPNATGLFYGAQTLRQLLPQQIFSPAFVEGVEWSVPGIEIEDYPRFPWRGLLLDVARHFMPKDFLKKFIDVLALHKMNRLHLHLTDDQGWRIEIKKYPRLTEVGAWRAETVVGHAGTKPWSFDGKPHGGFYTQDDIRELVAYAQERHVTLVPEIEMPGHAQAAIAAYPELGNTGQELPVWTGWGVNQNIFNADEKTILFLQDVLEEVIALFPSEYIHIGGDEAVKNQWEASETVQARIKELGLADEAEMQRYFIARMHDFLAEKGRKLIGWDEILDGGLGASPAIMAWRSEEKAVQAARAGNDVVMALTSHTYFDYYQGPKETEPLAIGGDLPLEKAYEFEPLPSALTQQEAKRILGGQGQLWTEYIPTPEHLEYMAYPRACALAEALWTPPGLRQYPGFLHRLPNHLERLKQLNVNYRPLQKISSP